MTKFISKELAVTATSLYLQHDTSRCHTAAWRHVESRTAIKVHAGTLGKITIKSVKKTPFQLWLGLRTKAPSCEFTDEKVQWC